MIVDPRHYLLALPSGQHETAARELFLGVRSVAIQERSQSNAGARLLDVRRARI